MAKHNKAKSGIETKNLAQLFGSRSIKDINLLELVKPGGYAEKVANELQQQKKTGRSQVRKLFAEFRQIFDYVDRKLKNDNDRLDLYSEAGIKLYMLYPIIAYQEKRGIISSEFAELTSKLVDNLNNDPSKRNFEQAKNFLIALVAYMKQEGQR